MKFISKILLIVGFFVFTFPFQFSAAAENNPYEMANTVAGQTFSEIKANKDKLADKAFLNSLIDTKLMPYVDVKYAAYKVMGTNLKKTTPKEREEFTEAFGAYLKRAIADAIGKYTDQELELSPVKKVADNENIVSVKFLIKQAGKQDIAMVLKARKNGKTGEWKVFDLVAENISILDAKQAEISPIIHDKGIKAAISALEKNSQLSK